MQKVNINDFQKLDIRIGTVIKAEVPKWSHWVIKLTVDFASEAKSSKNRPSSRVRIEPKSREVRSGGDEEIGNKVIFAGLLNFYKQEELEGKQFPFIVNLEPKKMGPEGDFSEGMMLAATISAKSGKEEDEEPVLITPVKKLPNGARVR